MDDHFAAAFVNYGKLCLQQKNFPQAETLLQKAVSVEPNNAESLMLLADAQYMNRHFDAAITSAQPGALVGRRSIPPLFITSPPAPISRRTGSRRRWPSFACSWGRNPRDRVPTTCAATLRRSKPTTNALPSSLSFRSSGERRDFECLALAVCPNLCGNRNSLLTLDSYGAGFSAGLAAIAVLV